MNVIIISLIYDHNSSTELLDPKKIKIIIFCWALFEYKFPNLKLIFAGSNCLDILGTMADDPEWLTAQRKEVKIIKRWLHKYNNDLHRFA